MDNYQLHDNRVTIAYPAPVGALIAHAATNARTATAMVGPSSVDDEDPLTRWETEMANAAVAERVTEQLRVQDKAAASILAGVTPTGAVHAELDVSDLVAASSWLNRLYITWMTTIAGRPTSIGQSQDALLDDELADLLGEEVQPQPTSLDLQTAVGFLLAQLAQELLVVHEHATTRP